MDKKKTVVVIGSIGMSPPMKRTAEPSIITPVRPQGKKGKKGKYKKDWD